MCAKSSKSTNDFAESVIENGEVLTIERMTEAHLPEVMPIEREVFAPGWSEETFRNDLRNPAALYLVLRLNGKLVAYAGMWLVLDEAHITNVAVKPEYRRRNFAKRLIHRLLTIARQRGCVKATLEVRISNTPAQKLYEKFGFRPVAIRPKYYDNTEDALIMWLEGLDTPEYAAVLQAIEQEFSKRKR
ncbi:MAG: ribosomal protein S18-alanine N-acetyltransferase [Fimbriimonadales bacterium]|nr:ribosomal protein S18-alanine N-acetyltransferase [Fimbriimonadales bacterium]MDW8051373.1 ribosomal protein S18-alanine N-acetyltransferase [Armatimonadota bacterium]